MKMKKSYIKPVVLFMILLLSILVGCSTGATDPKDETSFPSDSEGTSASTTVVSETLIPTPSPEPTILETSTPSTTQAEEIYEVADIWNGDVTRVQFGKYVWRVLSIEDGKALLITENIVEKKVIHEVWKTTMWEDTDIRKYLNGDFYDGFTDDEKKLISETKNKNPNNQWFDTEAGKDTTDKVFLLSLDEVVKYFGDSGQLANKNPDNENKIDDEYNTARIAKYEDGTEGYWWLRTFGDNSASTAVVDYDGMIGVDGAFFISEGGVRPALWLKQE